MNKMSCVAAFVVGLVAVCWVGAGYVGGSALALVVTALIGGVYLIGALELRRFHQATGALDGALASIPSDLAHPGEWLAHVPAALQNPVRLRIEGERVGLPGPALTPYLVGLLVLLGMLGTFLGMVVTLNGAVIALESTTDLQTIRAALAAPVKGLGVAFGTSVAGVSASAMLGLMSALCRRARLKSAQRLDTKIATELRSFSLAHQRQEAYTALRTQATVLPALVDKLQAMMVQMELHGRQTNERQLAEQARFHGEAREIYTALAASVGDSLERSLTESARLAGETIQPVVVETMAGIARETVALQQRVADTVGLQLDGLALRFDDTVTAVADTWTAALAHHERTSDTLSDRLQQGLAAYAASFEQRSAALLSSVDAAHAALRVELAATTNGVAEQASARHARLAETVETQLHGISTRFDGAIDTVAETWTRALASHEQAGDRLAAELKHSLDAFGATFAERSETLLASVSERAEAMQAKLERADEARLNALTQGLESMAGALRQEWHQVGAQTLAQQQQICQTLGETARDIAATAQARANETIGQVAGLMQTAAEAPRAAAEVIGELRKELSASIARDNAMLTERSRIMETLGALLSAINHASTEQRQAIDALVASSATLLDRVGERFAEGVDAQATKMAGAAEQISGAAVEVASLGEAFGLAMQLFSESSEKLTAALQRIEGALGKSMTRSDEQLAYYVAQAREVIDLSIMSQRRIVEDLQQLTSRQPLLAGEA